MQYNLLYCTVLYCVVGLYSHSNSYTFSYQLYYLNITQYNLLYCNVMYCTVLYFVVGLNVEAALTMLLRAKANINQSQGQGQELGP